MGRLATAWNALTGELDRQFHGLGIVRARRIQKGWVIRTAGQGRGRRWWVCGVRGPAGMYGLIQLEAKLVEVHGVRSPARLRAMGVEPDKNEELYLEADALVVIEYLDWQTEDDGTADGAGPGGAVGGSPVAGDPAPTASTDRAERTGS